MATVEEEYSKIQASGKRPIPGQSLANDPENPAPYEQAPKFTSVHAASEYLWESFIEPVTYTSLMETVGSGVPIMDVVQIILFSEFQKGLWNPDLMIMLFEPATYMIMALAERQDLDMVIYSGEDDDELADFNLMFNIEGFANPSAGYFDIYMLPMRCEGFDGATMYITEVGYEFN